MRRSVNPPVASSAAASPAAPADAASDAEAAGAPADPADRTWAPTEKMRAAKAKLLIALRHDPLMDPAQLPLLHLAAQMGLPETTVRDWGKHPEFRKWLLEKHETEERAQFLLDASLIEIGSRLSKMADKDLIQATKLLNEVVARQAEQAAPPSADLGAKTPEQLVALLKQVAPALLVAAGVPTTTQPQAQES